MSTIEIRTVVIGNCAECGTHVYQTSEGDGFFRMCMHFNGGIDYFSKFERTGTPDLSSSTNVTKVADDLVKTINDNLNHGTPDGSPEKSTSDLNQVADDIATAVNSQPKNDSERIVDLLTCILVELKELNDEKKKDKPPPFVSPLGNTTPRQIL